MNNIEQLIVRACKSNDAYKRLKSINRRFFYIDDKYDQKIFTIRLLTDFCFKYNLIGSKFVMGLVSDTWDYIKEQVPSTDVSIEERVLVGLIRAIRYTCSQKLIEIGYKVPKRFHNKMLTLNEWSIIIQSELS